MGQVSFWWVIVCGLVVVFHYERQRQMVVRDRARYKRETDLVLRAAREQLTAVSEHVRKEAAHSSGELAGPVVEPERRQLEAERRRVDAWRICALERGRQLKAAGFQPKAYRPPAGDERVPASIMDIGNEKVTH
jgi:hypothetical protein